MSLDQSFNTADFNENDHNEIKQFMEAERQKARFQENVHSLTSMCWSKCITGKITGGTVDRTENTCLDNCVNRYIDAQKAVISQLEQVGNRS